MPDAGWAPVKTCLERHRQGRLCHMKLHQHRGLRAMPPARAKPGIMCWSQAGRTMMLHNVPLL
jgi:hypothetical protein